jgi:hypothetical protein
LLEDANAVDREANGARRTICPALYAALPRVHDHHRHPIKVVT